MNFKYIVAGIARKYVPESVLFKIMKLRGGGNAAEVDPDLYFSETLALMKANNLELSGKHVLEVGSGRYARMAVRMLAAGADRITLIDLYAVPLHAPEHMSMLVEDCRKLGLDWDNVRLRIEVIKDDITNLVSPPADKQVDVVISSSVIEHVREPTLIFRSCWDWLKPGGTTHHIIDLRDHNLQFRYPFEMLSYSQEVWSRWFDLRGGFHLNRWRASDYIEALAEAGFINISYDGFMRDLDGARESLSRLDNSFRSIPLEMLSILKLYVYAEKSS